MRKMRCPRCGGKVYINESPCPFCSSYIDWSSVPVKQSKKGIIIAIIFAVIIIVVVSDYAINRQGNITEHQKSTNIVAKTKQSDSQTETEVPNYVEIKTTNIFNDWEITINGAEIAEYITVSKYSRFTPVEGDKYLLVDITITNKGKTADTFLASYSFLGISAKINCGEYVYSASNLLGYNDDIHDTTLNPLSSKTGIIAYSLPDDIADSSDELIMTIAKGTDSLKIKIR